MTTLIELRDKSTALHARVTQIVEKDKRDGLGADEINDVVAAIDDVERAITRIEHALEPPTGPR